MKAKLLVVAMGIISGLVVGEGVLRLAGYSYPMLHQTDPERGYSLIPNTRGLWWLENVNEVRINSDGFRDKEHELEKPPGTFRIAILGDSYAEAREVPLETTFWSRLESQFTECNPGKQRIEVLNFGVSGYGTASELLTLRHRVLRYAPDLVILMFTTNNDVLDNYRKFKGTDEIPYFTLENGSLVQDRSFTSSAKYHRHDSALFRSWVWLHNASRLIQLAHHAQFGLKGLIKRWRETAPSNTSVSDVSTNGPKPATLTNASVAPLVGLHNVVYREPDDDDWQAAWAVTEALVAQVAKEVKGSGARFLLAVIGTEVQVHPNAEVRRTMTERLAVSDLFYPDRRLQDLATVHNLDLVDLTLPMQEIALRDGTYFHGFGNDLGNGHWNADGHRIVADLLTQRLCSATLERP